MQKKKIKTKLKMKIIKNEEEFKMMIENANDDF